MDAMAERRAALAKKLDNTLMEQLMAFSRAEFGDGWEARMARALLLPGAPPFEQAELDLIVPWSLLVYPAAENGLSVGDRYLIDHIHELTSELRELLRAQLRASCSLWQVERVDRGKGAELRDLLTQERYYVHERLGTQHLTTDLALLARVVTVNGISFIAGVHPQPLRSSDVFGIVDAARKHFRVRTRPVKASQLANPEFQEWLIQQWRAFVFAAIAPPALHNTDGDPLVETVDHFAYEVARESELLSALHRIPGAEAPREEEGATVVVVTRAGKRGSSMAGQPVIVGFLRLGGGRLRAETNSGKRAKAVRKGVEKVARNLLRHTLREESSSVQMMQEIAARAARGKAPAPRPPQPAEMLEIVREFKRQHYARWMDERIPALGGVTPRAAARSKTKREQLEHLLRDFERNEAGLPEGERADIGAIRRELGM